MSYVLILNISQNSCIFWDMIQLKIFKSTIPCIHLSICNTHHLRHLVFDFQKDCMSTVALQTKQCGIGSATCSHYKYFKWVFWKMSHWQWLGTVLKMVLLCLILLLNEKEKSSHLSSQISEKYLVLFL